MDFSLECAIRMEAVDISDIALVHRNVSRLLVNRSTSETTSETIRFLTTLERRLSDYLIENWWDKQEPQERGRKKRT